jgi:hypothetical protein
LKQKIRDTWNIKISAGDINILRLSVIKSGLIYLKSWKKKHWELLSEAHKLYNQFFRFEREGEFDIYYSVDKRIRDWVKPFYIDLRSDIAKAMLSQDTAEVAFAMRLTGSRADYQDILISSINHMYDSLCVYGEIYGRGRIVARRFYAHTDTATIGVLGRSPSKSI